MKTDDLNLIDGECYYFGWEGLPNALNIGVYREKSEKRVVGGLSFLWSSGKSLGIVNHDIEWIEHAGNHVDTPLSVAIEKAKARYPEYFI